jgi:hypothetical protein
MLGVEEVHKLVFTTPFTMLVRARHFASSVVTPRTISHCLPASFPTTERIER